MFLSLSKEFAKRRSVSIIIMYVLSLVLLGLVFSAISRAADYVPPEIEKPKKLQLVVGKSIILKSPTPVKRVSIADPGIAAFILLSPKEIYITGKASGITNLTLWQNRNKNFTRYSRSKKRSASLQLMIPLPFQAGSPARLIFLRQWLWPKHMRPTRAMSATCLR
ncbi:MAG: pilus assembly protein N-terminal domain-containing protein [Deltaproteobacteria bacterium]|nr:pilus assembly protein N-terminal domain-containing protein [Deltaproteobacteria bacterium]